MTTKRRCREWSFKLYVLLLALIFNLGCASSSRYSLNKAECRMDYCFKIDRVPFIVQKQNYCGPAALAMVMNYYGITISQEEIAEEIYQPGIKGTLSMQLVLYPIQKGFEAEMYNGNFNDLKEKIKAWFPLIVSVKEDGKDKVHYMVVWGYDEFNRQVFVHSSNKMAQAIEYETFLDMWKRADYLTVWIYPLNRTEKPAFGPK